MNPPDSELMGYVVRMVIPLRREFGRVLNVSDFFENQTYAVEVIDEALTSQNERLQNYANYVQGRLFGPRNTSRLGIGASQFSSASDSLIQATTPSDEAIKIRDSSEVDRVKVQNEMQARYKMGLR